MRCSYCGYEHGVIGDVVCPITFASSIRKFYVEKHRPQRINFELWSPIEICKLELSYEERSEILKAKARKRVLIEIKNKNIDTKRITENLLKHRYRGGRKKGSKNKPKPTSHTDSSPETTPEA